MESEMSNLGNLIVDDINQTTDIILKKVYSVLQ